jgi:hypothetical protein
VTATLELTAAIELLTASGYRVSKARATVARAPKIRAAQWPGRHAMTDDLEAGFVPADYLGQARAGWCAPTALALLPERMRGAPVPPIAEREAAGWRPIVARLTGTNSDGRNFVGDAKTVDAGAIVGWSEPADWHARYCVGGRS